MVKGWTCRAFPSLILYRILTRQDPHTTPYMWQEEPVVFEPKLITEPTTGRVWHYNADGSWQYVDTGTTE